MTLFSQRKGIRPASKALQRESVEEDLRNRLWSGLQIALWDHWSPCDYMGFQSEDSKGVELVVKGTASSVVGQQDVVPTASRQSYPAPSGITLRLVLFSIRRVKICRAAPEARQCKRTTGKSRTVMRCTHNSALLSGYSQRGEHISQMMNDELRETTRELQ